MGIFDSIRGIFGGQTVDKGPCLSQDTLKEYCQGECKEAETVAAHLTLCWTCRGKHKQLQRLLQAVRKLGSAVDASSTKPTQDS